VAPDLNQISRAGQTVRLEPRAVELLAFLARRAGEVVSRDELLAALWPGVIVGDNALTQVVTKLRKALGDTAREPTYIEAIAKRGYRLIAPVEPAGSHPSSHPPPPPPAEAPARDGTQHPVRRSRVPRSIVAGAAVLAVAAAGWWLLPAPDDGLPEAPWQALSAPGLTLPTLIVRPIEAIAEDSDKLIARGLTADLVNDLSKVSGLRVVSGGTADGAAPGHSEAVSARASGSAAKAAGRYALAGTLQSDRKTLRLQVRLIDVGTGRQLWSQRFERELRDLFALQDDLTRSVLEQLPIKVSQAETANLAQRYTRSVAAYEQFLRAQAALQARQREQNGQARALYWRAIELDPAFARAYAGLAMTHALAYQLGWDGEAALGRAAELAATAVQMSPGLAEAHWVYGFVETQRRRHADAIAHLHRALRLNPSYSRRLRLAGRHQDLYRRARGECAAAAHRVAPQPRCRLAVLPAARPCLLLHRRSRASARQSRASPGAQCRQRGGARLPGRGARTAR
jgi:DNA-binding winged helix-turn-helix (wHTH) protein/TolB-like protein